MATNVVMPQMGESIAEGTIVRWIKKVGENVDRDEPLFEISTDKVDAEIPSPGAGVLTEIKVKEGETVPVNSVVAVIGGENAASALPEAAVGQPDAGSGQPEAGSRQPEAGSRAAGSRKPAAGSCERAAGSRKREAGSRRAASSSRRRWCGGSRKSTTSTSARSTAPGSADA